MYSVGDLVLVNNARRHGRKGDKLTQRWTGPFTVVKINKSGTLKLDGRKALVNVKLVKPYRKEEGNSKDQDTDNVMIIEEQPAPLYMPFLPVGPTWQEQCATAINLKIRSKLVAIEPREINIQTKPTQTVKIRGDGNCLFC